MFLIFIYLSAAFVDKKYLTHKNLIYILLFLISCTNVKCLQHNLTMSKPKVLITNPDIPKIAYDILDKECDVITNTELPYPKQEDIIAKVKGVDAIFWVSKTRLDKNILDAAGPQLHVISTMSAGLDNVDIPEVKKRGIKLGHTPKVLSDAVSEIAVLLTLATLRRLQEGREKIENGEWTFGLRWMLGQDIRGATVGIVGLGGIGQSTAKKLKAFDVGKIIYSGHREKPEGKELGATFVSFDDLLTQSDIVIISCPLTPETKEMFNETAFNKMKETAVLINIARGGIVHQPSLVKALKTKRIFGAGLDVMTPEPLPVDNELLHLSNCVLMPHLGSATIKTRNDMAELAARNILAGLKNKPMLAPA